ncbi:hypothetical protein [Microbispora bryophytorum]
MGARVRQRRGAGDGFEEWPGEAGRAMACFPGGDRGRVRAVRHDATGPR